jgi:DNA methyltransferase 1-associated protein 1
LEAQIALLGSDLIDDVNVLSPDRLSREVKNLQSALLGTKKEEAEAPTIAPEFTGRMKKKAKVIKKLVPWEPFSYHSRGETGDECKDLILTHCRPRDDPNKEINAFLKYNKPLEILRYDAALYEEKLQNASWSKEETDFLMDLCEQFDARLYLVSDRWDSQRFPARTLEEIKERFFSVQKALGSKDNFNFDYEAERLRKRHGEIQYNRTGHEVWEEFEAKKGYDKIDAELTKAKAAPTRLRSLLNQKPGNAAVSNLKTEKKMEAWSPGDAKVKQPAKKKSKTGGSSVQNAQMSAKVDTYLRNLKIPVRPSNHKEAGKLHGELRNKVLMVLDIETLLTQKEYENELLKIQIEYLKNKK